MHPRRGLYREVKDHEADHAHQADHGHDKEGWTISRIRKAIAQLALGAGFADGQIALEELALTTTGAAATHAVFQREHGGIFGCGHVDYLRPSRKNEAIDYRDVGLHGAWHKRVFCLSHKPMKYEGV